MAGFLIDSVARRRTAAVPALLTACLLAAGCGGSSKPRPFPGGIKPIGSPDLKTNIVGLMKANQPELKNVKADCPSTFSKFPVRCQFTATQVGPPPGSSKKDKKAFPGAYRVGGTISIFGVYFRTRTYEYSLNYAPTH
jgi:hypothetical protein